MDESPISLLSSLSDGILRNLKTVQTSQAEQILANDRLEQAIDELRVYVQSQFAQLAAQLLACRAELAATTEILKAAQAQNRVEPASSRTIVH
jgi:hypothetical protein